MFRSLPTTPGGSGGEVSNLRRTVDPTVTETGSGFRGEPRSGEGSRRLVGVWEDGLEIY